MKRRLFLVTTASLAAVACRKKKADPLKEGDVPLDPNGAPQAPLGDDPRDALDVLDWELPNEHGGDKRCTVLVPKGMPAGTKLPLLVALHGMGETVSKEKGSRGWIDSYALDRALFRLRRPPLSGADFEGLVKPERLGAINVALAKRRFGGVIVACPYLPAAIGRDIPYDLYGRWLGERLLPKLRAELPILDGAASTGIDGVSLGGITALRIGLARPDLFGVVGALQPAVSDGDMARGLADTIAEKLAGRPLRIVTSTEDAYREALETLHAELEARAIPHEFFIAEGPHDYVWNKGPGSIEMLLFHDRALKR